MSDFMKLSDRSKIEELIKTFHYTPTSIYENEELNKEINYVFFLENTEQEILSTRKYSISNILYARYYWFTKFMVSYETLYGKNSSMRQKQFKILEDIEYAGVLDCVVLKGIEDDLGYCDETTK